MMAFPDTTNHSFTPNVASPHRQIGVEFNAHGNLYSAICAVQSAKCAKVLSDLTAQTSAQNARSGSAKAKY